jgi:Restriction endonuclease
MALAEKPALLRWIYRSEFGSRVQLREILERGARAALGKDAIEAEAYAEANQSAFWSYLLTAQADDERRGISRIFHVVDPMARILQWCAPNVELTPSQARRLARLRHRPSMLRMIDGLTDREYEALACVALKLVGASEVNLTPAGNEGGVDFFALIPAPAQCHLFSGTNHPLRFIGQCKKYNSAVQANAVKEFLTTINEVKHAGEPKTERIVPSWFRANRGPIIGCLIAHRGFQAGASTRARNHGIITADSLDIAEMLSLSRGLPEDLNGEHRALDCKRRVAALLT